MEPVNVGEYEALAQALMEQGAWDYLNGGSDDEVTLRACRTAFERIQLRPRMLVDMSKLDMSTTVLGTPVSMPILVAPMAYHCLAHPEGECATARGVGMSRTVLTCSTFATRSIEDVAAVATEPLWFQMYTYRGLEVPGQLVRRAQAAGYRAVVVTVDTPLLGKRERDIRNDFKLPPHISAANIEFDHSESYIPVPTLLTWDSLDWLRGITSLPIVLKGVLTAEDAVMAVERGVQAIIVSNHGGRQLDTEITSIEALPEIVDAVAGRCEVYVDGGIRRGTDVIKALALGARAVLLGRPVLWGLAVNGAEGVHRVLEILRTELELAMVLSGRPTIASIDRSLVKLP